MEIHRKFPVEPVVILRPLRAVILSPLKDGRRIWRSGQAPAEESKTKILRPFEAQDDRSWCALIFSLLILPLILSSKLWAFDIEGRINVAPPWPKIQKIEVKKEKDKGSCGHSQGSQALLISEEGYLRNAVVWLEGQLDQDAAPVLSGTGFYSKLETKPVPTENRYSSKPILDQKNCHFDPHILLVPQGQSFLIGNADPIGHDVRAFDGSHMLFRFEMEPNSDPVEKKFEKPGHFVIRCGLHPWMHAYVINVDHPHYALSDTGGKFYLKDIPKGNYMLKIWHERLGDVEVPIEVSKSITDFSFTFPRITLDEE